MSSAMRRRRSSLGILEKVPIDVTNEPNFGQLRLPLTTRQFQKTLPTHEKMLPTPNVWASLHAQRTIATMNDRLDRARTGKRFSTERSRLPSPVKLPKLGKKLKIDKVPRPEVPIFHLRKDSPKRSTLQENARKITKLPELQRKIIKKRFEVPIFQIAKKQQQLGKTEHQSRVLPKLKPQRHLTTVLPIPRRTGCVQYFKCKHPLMPKKSTPVVRFLKSPKQTQHGNKSYETRLKAFHIAQPTHLKIQQGMDKNNSNVSRQQRQTGTLHGLAKSYGPRKSFGLSGCIRAHSNTQPNENMNNKRRQLKKAKSVPKPKPPTMMNKKREKRENLGHLLEDLLDKKTLMECRSIKFKKTGPLFKLVTSSIEGRSNLYDGKFEKQLKKPLIYNYPFVRNLSQSFSVNYRPAFVMEDRSFLEIKPDLNDI
ncbi:GH12453 [Drosophila grimshawi]|uniref:GH12453 n=2 Tax=Drosophila grimshawi TaxID=7222 RepID=B4JJA2_DROGR|nr:GH12453 [Drosophila grimshawi]